MEAWFFLIVPDLPTDVSGQTNSVEFIKYAVGSGAHVNSGDPIAAVRVGKTLFVIETVVGAKVIELPCSVGESVRVGNPIAKMAIDEEEKSKAYRTFSRIRKAENQV